MTTVLSLHEQKFLQVHNLEEMWMFLKKTKLSGQQDFNKQTKNPIMRLELHFLNLHMLNAITKNLVKGQNKDANSQSLTCCLSGC